MSDGRQIDTHDVNIMLFLHYITSTSQTVTDTDIKLADFRKVTKRADFYSLNLVSKFITPNSVTPKLTSHTEKDADRIAYK